MRGRTKILSRDESGNLSAHIETENLIIRSIREDDLGHLNALKLQESLGFARVADMQKAFRTASGALEMRPRAFFELDLQRLVEAPRSGLASNHEAVKVGEVSTRGRKGSKKSGETINL